MAIHEKLQKVQFEMKAPKNLYNSFGKYKYRNAEGILEAFKPYGKKYGMTLVVGDDVLFDSGRTYIVATAVLTDVESGETISNKALARESQEKKGMDDSQITGTASSYARKYALNGLFLLDDTKDADSDEYKVENDAKKQTDGKISKKEIAALDALLKSKKISIDFVCGLYKLKSLDDMNGKIYTNIMAHIDEIKKKQEEK